MVGAWKAKEIISISRSPLRLENHDYNYEVGIQPFYQLGDIPNTSLHVPEDISKL
jgi:hypothetical protein